MAELSRPDVASEIVALQEAWMAAWIANDGAVLERMLAPEFSLVVSARPEARVDRAAWLRTAGGEYTCASFRYDAMQVRDFGEVIAVSSLATQRATAPAFAPWSETAQARAGCSTRTRSRRR